MSKAGIILVLFTLLAVAVSWQCWIESMADIRAEMESLRAEAQRAAREYDTAIAAAGNALRAREQVNAETLERMARLENIIADADSICIPASLRDYFATATSDPPSGGTSGANSDSRPERH